MLDLTEVDAIIVVRVYVLTPKLVGIIVVIPSERIRQVIKDT
ncbi:hypothetical protein [Halococcus sediminicola]|nr:hypothetical protein [Halococcus sediminicola]